jgi:hypothetical protein
MAMIWVESGWREEDFLASLGNDRWREGWVGSKYDDEGGGEEDWGASGDGGWMLDGSESGGGGGG